MPCVTGIPSTSHTSEYMRLKETLGNDFSTTYYNYVKICKNVADRHYGEAIRLTNLLTNSTDQYKFQTEIYELAGDTAKAFIAQKHYTAVKDSVNNVIMSEEMVGSANDIAVIERQNEECSERSERMKWGMLALVPVACLMPFAACKINRRKYTRKLQQQNKELLIARDKAKEAERMKIKFIQNMSHEVRTPLNIISGFAQVISEPNNNIAEEERAEIAARIANSTNNIVNIINEILDISGKESIHYIDKNDMMYCNEVARKVLDQFVDNEEGNEVRFESDLKDSYKIKTNKQEVEKILGNLLKNACKFTEKGTVTVNCHLDEMENDMVCFSITDTGMGIKEGEEEKIFEHFYKVDAYKEGVGLGLPLARRVARQLGGDVVLDTSYKEGSRFILKLPVARSEFALVGSPHHLLTQRVEITLSCPFDNPHIIRCLAKGQTGSLTAVLGTPVKGDEEIMRTALYRQTDLRIVGDDDRTDVRGVWGNGSHREHAGTRHDDRTSYGE